MTDRTLGVLLACATGSLLLARAAAADPADLARCASIAAADARLVCYDGLAGRQGAAASGTPAPTPASPAAAPRAPADRVAVPAPAAPAAAAAAAAPAAPAAPAAASAPAATDGAATFGLSNAQLHVAPVGPESIQAKVLRITEDRSGNAQVVLDNGQIWASLDPDLRVGPGDVVTIRRAALGSYVLKVAKYLYHVHRLQ
jgi:hypothetical protein